MGEPPRVEGRYSRAFERAYWREVREEAWRTTLADLELHKVPVAVGIVAQAIILAVIWVSTGTKEMEDRVVDLLLGTVPLIATAIVAFIYHFNNAPAALHRRLSEERDALKSRVGELEAERNPHIGWREWREPDSDRRSGLRIEFSNGPFSKPATDIRPVLTVIEPKRFDVSHRDLYQGERFELKPGETKAFYVVRYNVQENTYKFGESFFYDEDLENPAPEYRVPDDRCVVDVAVYWDGPPLRTRYLLSVSPEKRLTWEKIHAEVEHP